MRRATHRSVGPIAIAGRGACGALGLALRPFALALRARQLELRRTPFVDATGAPVAASLATALDPQRHGDERLDDLLAPAVAEALRATRVDGPLTVVVAAPGGASTTAAADRALLAALAARLDRPLAGASVVVRGDHPAGAAALRIGRRLLREGAGEVVVAAASSPLDEALVARLDREGRLWRDERRGRILGEAAGALLLRVGRGGRGAGVLAEVEHEPQGGLARGGVGLMLRRARGALVDDAFDLVICDVNGEPDRTDAWADDVEAAGSAIAPVDVEAWPDLTGDLGAATGVVATAVALELAAIGALPRSNVAIALRGDDASIGAITLELPSGGSDFVASLDAPVARRVRRGPVTRSAAERAQAERAARSLLEDVAAMGLLLAPGPAGPDRQAAARRLLDAYDALCALALPGRGVEPYLDLLATADAWTREVDPPDRGRRFVGSLLGAHLRGASRAARAAPGAPLTGGRRSSSR